MPEPRTFKCFRCGKRRSMHDSRQKYRYKDGYVCKSCTEDIDRIVRPR